MSDTPAPRAPEYDEEVAGIISLQLYDAVSCAALLERVRATAGWTQAVVSVSAGEGEFIPAARPETRAASTVCLAPGSDELLDFEDRIARLVRPAVSKIWRADLTRQDGTHAVRYEPGGFYAPHTDTGEDLLDRYFTVLCYLNDDFEGGETCFPGIGYSVAPRRGKAVVFPATYLHRAERVASGEKYVMVSWLTGRPPVRWI